MEPSRVFVCSGESLSTFKNASGELLPVRDQKDTLPAESSVFIVDDENCNWSAADLKALMESHLLVYRLSNPFNEDRLSTLKELLTANQNGKAEPEPENLLVIVDAGSLRKGFLKTGHMETALRYLRAEVREEVKQMLKNPEESISHQMSWEANIKDILENHMEKMNDIRHLTIRLGFEAAIYRDTASHDTASCSRKHLVYDLNSQEGSSTKGLNAIEYKRCEDRFIAGVATHLGQLTDPTSQWRMGCEARDTAMKDSMKKGLQNARTDSPELFDFVIDTEDLKKTYWLASSHGLLESLRPGKARSIVKNGFGELESSLEAAKFGGLVTIDLKEIEGFRRIASQVENYLNGGSTSRPLSFAVFGQPGAGKSFGVKQVIKEILTKKGKDMETHEFNLSQFSRDADLKAAFEKIRRSNLSEKTPIVFFDEFDCTFGEPMGWLKYFVDPMDLGGYWTQTFSDGRANDPEFRPLGGGIFIFVGGTCKTWGDFKGDPEPNYNYHQFDLSRFKGYPDLVKEFSMLQTVKLSGKLPVALFKNYNCKLGEKNLGWLQYFLAPMQDGEFLDEYGAPQPLTPGIFFFQETGLPQDLAPEVERAAKKPDFESRLRGYINARDGVHSTEDVSHVKTTLRNYLQPSNKRGQARPLSIGVSANTDFTLDKIIELVNGVLDEIKRARQDTLPSNVLDSNVPLPTSIKRKWEACVKGTVDIAGPNPIASDDKMYQIRRAILLRAQLQQRLGRQHDESIAMDEGFLDAFLDTKEFRHGARSIEVILDMSKLPEKLPDRYNISAEIFPAKTQLELQVDASEFLKHAKLLGGKTFRITTGATLGEEVTLKFSAIDQWRISVADLLDDGVVQYFITSDNGKYLGLCDKFKLVLDDRTERSKWKIKRSFVDKKIYSSIIQDDERWLGLDQDSNSTIISGGGGQPTQWCFTEVLPSGSSILTEAGVE
ncbi:hypothetical protein AFCA_010488 [Aspergillus flavus]|uniref:ATPase AAA-type core domain-containing protein n=1 Tax=Aspergillus flavus TaxID=5059 RepID=A0AB74CGS5_ASPFL|nr:hypothetical protein CA14_006929 [Aspergillus flavus]UDD63215.1 hypothetical protein AFCA_010488 [Aspergillus flavus]